MEQNANEDHHPRTPRAIPDKHMFTVCEVAALLGVNHKTVRAEIAAGRIKSIPLGRLIRIPRAEVLRLLGQ